GAGLGTGVLVAQADGVAELVAHDARQGPGRDVAEAGAVDQELAAPAAGAREERARQVLAAADPAHVEDDAVVAAAAVTVLAARVDEVDPTGRLPGAARAADAPEAE